LQREHGHAAGALHQDGLPGFHLCLDHQSAPRRQRGTWKGRACDRIQVGRRLDDTLGGQADQILGTSIGIAAQRGPKPFRRGPPRNPVRKEGRDHAIANLDAPDALARFDHHTRPIGERHERACEPLFRQFGDIDEIAIIERRSLETNDDLAGLRLGPIALDKLEPIEASSLNDHGAQDNAPFKNAWGSKHLQTP
jgi:hypothetical protein